MKPLLDYLKSKWTSSLYAMWLGGSLAAVYRPNPTDLGVWVVLLPTILLVTVFNRPKSDPS
jgi:hypothetical protein